MNYDNTVAAHYLHGDLLNSIKSALPKIGKTVETVTVEDLGPVDEFHVGGRLATERFLDQLNFSSGSHILDVGCGLGGAARFTASKYNSQVTGIDLTPEYIETGNALNEWVKLDGKVTLHNENALAMSFNNESFDGAYMLHVAMNIEDKVELFREIHRVLRPGASFGVYDIMRTNAGALTFPVPWAASDRTSPLATADQYRQALNDAGFKVSKEENRRDFAIEFFKNLKAKNEANGGPPPLGLHTLMKESTSAKLKNMVDNFVSDFVAPVEIIAFKN